MIQSIIIDKKLFNKQQAIKWIKDNGFIVNTNTYNFDNTNYYRFRQSSPLKKYKYRMKLIKKGIYFVLAY